MNILMVCHYGMYQNLQNSFVHAQAAAYAALGHRVRAIVPVAWGKRSSFDGKRFSSMARKLADGVEICAIRHFSLSNYGKRHFNASCAIAALRGQLPKLLQDFQPDVIHAHTLGFDSEIGAWLKRKLGIPLVVTTHGSDAAIPLEQGEGAYIQKWCSQADRIVAVSSALARKVRTCGTQTPVDVILNGFRVANITPGEKDPLAWVCVCNLLAQKQVDVTLRAFAQVHKRHPGSTLTVIGQGPERENLENLAKSLQITDAVRFLGQLPNAQVLQEMARAQFFVMPSVREGFGIVYLEAMASGCITVGTEGEGIADLIVSGENGFLVPPKQPQTIAQCILHCINGPQQAGNIAQRGREAALNLTWMRNAQCHIALFKEIIL